jgi:protein arginine N-methyltransferase 2
MEDPTQPSAPALSMEKVQGMVEACRTGTMHIIQQLMAENSLYARQQDDETGRSPLMAAAATGNGALCQHLLEAGAPWNAVDRQGQCAGNYATDNQHWGVVNLLVDWGVRAEFILGMIERSRRDNSETRSHGDVAFEDGNSGNPQSQSQSQPQTAGTKPVEHEPCTKPDYLRQRLHYTADGNALLDSDQDAVMMEWERPLMQAHAQILMEGTGRRVLNVGFGMGIIDTALQNLQPAQHIIIEAHPDVYKRMLTDKWDQKPNVRICFGRWQDVIPALIKEGVIVDAIFYDTVREQMIDQLVLPTLLFLSLSHTYACIH